MAHTNTIRQYAKQKGISRKRAREILELNELTSQVLPVISQFTLDRISYDEFATKAVPMIKQAYHNGEFNEPIFGTVHNPDTPIMNKVTTMSMQVGANGSKERADALWLFMSTVCELSNQNLSAEERQEMLQSLKTVLDGVVKGKETA